jgi:hypothetical protein
MYDWIRGGDFSFGIRVKSGTIPDGTTARCTMKLADHKNTPPAPEAEEMVVFATEFVPASSGDGGNGQPSPAHWLFSGTWSQGEALDVGEYVADAKIMDADGATTQTSYVLINVRPEVTRKRF